MKFIEDNHIILMKAIKDIPRLKGLISPRY